MTKLSIYNRYLTIRALSQENQIKLHVNNKGAVQPAHSCSLISTFVVRLLERIMTYFATSKVSIYSRYTLKPSRLD